MRPMAAGPRLQPTTTEEEALWAAGKRYVAGVDEVGRGPIAGPVFAAAVILHPLGKYDWLNDVRDSKVVPAPERERLAALIRRDVLAFGIGSASVGEIDGWGIALANRTAMERALQALRIRPSFVLIDGPTGLSCPQPQKPIIDGDATCCSIAAASIVAKVTRDQVMRDLDVHYPAYGFAQHKGYATPDHLDRLRRFGACDQHRRSWARVRLVAGLDGSANDREEESHNAAG
jgi:ribonuclease HII